MRLKICLMAPMFLLSACSPSSDDSPQMNSEYLACYALDAATKEECVSKLNAKYIKARKMQDKHYAQEFQFKAEKQGFKQFINSHGLSCEAVNNGPEFNHAEQAYLVQCAPSEKYLMRFDYRIKKWYLISKENYYD